MSKLYTVTLNCTVSITTDLQYTLRLCEGSKAVPLGGKKGYLTCVTPGPLL